MQHTRRHALHGAVVRMWRLCQGTTVSRQQYLSDTTEWGYTDGRLRPFGNMTAEQVAAWTAAIGTIK